MYDRFTLATSKERITLRYNRDKLTIGEHYTSDFRQCKRNFLHAHFSLPAARPTRCQSHYDWLAIDGAGIVV
jgi:hypothetical protein